ncbi:MAG TPA: amidohydrolase family protein [Stellaceae bacterium]|nr:amidohydrolase family protein [Stellaceae bacterium]
MIIDIYNHFIPQPIWQRLGDLIPGHIAVKAFRELPTLYDVDARLRLLDGFQDMRQVLSLANPPIEMMGPPDRTPVVARMANDGLAALVDKYPERFPAFIASLPMNDVPATLIEIERAVGELGARGIQVFTNVLGVPLSAPQFRPIFRAIAKHDLPVWIHPIRGPNFPDYAAETVSEDEVWFTFGWPYETSAAVTRLIYSGIYDELPNLKIITHHMGGMIPYFANKIGLGFRQIFWGTTEKNPVAEERGLKRPPLDYFRMLYADTALNGAIAPTRCGHDFFTTPHCLFATDAPFDAERGRHLMSGTITAVKALETPSEEQARILAGNAMALLKL